MKRYRGYYIDGTVFRSEAEIDKFYRDSIIQKIKTFKDMMSRYADRYSRRELNRIAQEITDREQILFTDYGMTWEEIEAL